MIIILVILAALAPAAWLLWTIYQKDSDQPEPKKWLAKGFVYGIGSAFLSLAISMPASMVLGMNIDNQVYSTFVEAVGDAFLLAAIPEEVAKLFMLWLLLRKNPFFDEHLTALSMPFALVWALPPWRMLFILLVGLEMDRG